MITYDGHVLDEERTGALFDFRLALCMLISAWWGTGRMGAARILSALPAAMYFKAAA